MADPKEGYNSGVNRNVSGTIDDSGNFISAANSTTTTLTSEVKLVIIEHIPVTAIANPVTAASWISRDGYTSGRIYMNLPASVTGSPLMQIAYSNDAGVTTSQWTTIYTFAGTTLEDGIVEFRDALEHSTPAEPPTVAAIKALPFFKVRLSGGTGTGNIFCTVSMEK